MQASKPIRIAHVIGQMVNGGVESVVFNYYRNIDKTKYQFDFFYDTDSTQEPSQELLDMGARFYLIPAYKNITAYTAELCRIFSENKYHIVHSHMNTLSVFTLRAAKKAGVPVRIAHNHSTAGKGETKRNILKYILRPFAKVYPTHLVACSQHAGEWLFGRNGSFVVINNAIETEKFAYNNDVRVELRKKLGLSDAFVIGHIGRFCTTKNQEFLLDIFNHYTKKNDTACLLLVGDGEDFEKIKQKAQNLDLQDRVIFTGSVHDAYNYYQAMDMFILPSRFEGLGMVVVEAQVSGLDVMCSTGVPKSAQINNNVRFLDLDAGAEYWSKEIESFPKTQRTSYIDSARKCGFSIKSEVGKLADLYSDIYI